MKQINKVEKEFSRRYDFCCFWEVTQEKRTTAFPLLSMRITLGFIEETFIVDLLTLLHFFPLPLPVWFVQVKWFLKLFPSKSATVMSFIDGGGMVSSI